MALPYKSAPIRTLEELQASYEINVDITKTQFAQKLEAITSTLREVIHSSTYMLRSGLVVSVEGTWGTGKSSFVEILCNNLKQESISIVKYDSLYYGNVSEATDIFITSIFDEVREHYGLKLSDGTNIVKNITPRFELSNGVPSFTLDYTPTRKPTEIIKERLEKDLSRLPGKLIIIVDDIDRVPGKDAVHFLRIIRVLRELPNFIILLPIDRMALENLLKGEGIDNPKRYLEKIIDTSVDINPEQGDAKDFFQMLVTQKYSNENIDEPFMTRLWDIYLWEISLAIIRQYENIGGQKFTVNIHPTDARWLMLTPTQAKNGNLLVRKFMEMTYTLYGSNANYDFRVKDSRTLSKDIFMHYSEAIANTTFTEFMYGKLFLNIGPEQTLDGGTDGLSAMNIRWWNDKDGLLERREGADPNQRIGLWVPIPEAQDERQVYETFIKNKAHFVWDTVQSLAGAYLPEKAYQYLTHRALNKIVSSLDINFRLYDAAQSSKDYVSLQQAIRISVKNLIDIE